MNKVPMITCNPWNPVAKKNVLPYAPSEIVNGASQYSSPCNPVKINASTTVRIIPNSVPFRLPWINEWCAYVTVAPDDNRIIVFNNGISNGLRGSIPAGGQCAPSSTVGDSALWKYAQKILIKKNTSLTMNNATPRFNPFCTANVWCPKNEPSADTSRNHRIIANSTDKNPNVSNVPPLA